MNKNTRSELRGKKMRMINKILRRFRKKKMEPVKRPGPSTSESFYIKKLAMIAEGEPVLYKYEPLSSGLTNNLNLGIREFEEIVVEYPPEDLCIYPEYKGKPYFEIKYRENGKSIIGYGTYDPQVLSKYLKNYFISSTLWSRGRNKE